MSEETAEYVASWARKIASCGKKTLREAHAMYLRLARDTALPEDRRSAARKRARALALWLSRPKSPLKKCSLARDEAISSEAKERNEGASRRIVEVSRRRASAESTVYS